MSEGRWMLGEVNGEVRPHRELSPSSCYLCIEMIPTDEFGRTARMENGWHTFHWDQPVQVLVHDGKVIQAIRYGSGSGGEVFWQAVKRR